ncbi:MAG: hypothetical protein FWE36_08405 [Erysipelotrichales bacterium]|nr:hypothetical protein [Erysipelotrichales bacterium]
MKDFKDFAEKLHGDKITNLLKKYSENGKFSQAAILPATIDILEEYHKWLQPQIIYDEYETSWIHLLAGILIERINLKDINLELLKLPEDYALLKDALPECATKELMYKVFDFALSKYAMLEALQ